MWKTYNQMEEELQMGVIGVVIKTKMVMLKEIHSRFQSMLQNKKSEVKRQITSAWFQNVKQIFPLLLMLYIRIVCNNF